MPFKAKNLLVTGGAGFIGSNFIRYFLENYSQSKIVNLDVLSYAADLNNTNDFSNHSNYSFIKGDICDKNLVSEIFQKYNIDGVINFAAETHVDNSINNPEPFIKSNIIGVYNLLNTAFKFWMEKPFKHKKKYAEARFHQISTDEVYGSINKGSFSENSPYRPNSPYAASKASADLIVRSFNKTYGLNTTITLCTNNYGSNQHPEKLIPKTIKKIIENRPISIYGDGLNVRDWIHVMDHCEAIDIIFNSASSGETYNIGACNELSNLDLIKEINSISKKLFSNSISIEFVRDRYGHDFRYSLNSSKLEKNFKWKASRNFKKEIKKIIQAYLNEK